MFTMVNTSQMAANFPANLYARSRAVRALIARIYSRSHPILGSNGPGSEKPSIDSTFA
jgi:hypothetical protein